MPTLQKGQKLNRHAAEEAAIAAAPEPVFSITLTFASADEMVRGRTKSDLRATYGAYGAQHGDAALSKYIAAIEAAIAKRDADPERQARIAERKAQSAARKAAAA